MGEKRGSDRMGAGSLGSGGEAMKIDGGKSQRLRQLDTTGRWQSNKTVMGPLDEKSSESRKKLV